MAIKLYDLAGREDDRRFSPNCWRTRLALAHKGLAVETIPRRFTEKLAIAGSGQGRVPVLVDGDKTIADSWVIANYLEQAYHRRPSLFGGIGGVAAIRFIGNWADAVLLPGVARLIIVDVFAHLHEKDREYFGAGREKRFGATLEAVCAGREERLDAFRQTLQPLRTTLETQPFLGGEQPNYADYLVFGGFQWARCTSRFPLLAANDQVALWRTRMLDAFDGLARKTPGYDI